VALLLLPQSGSDCVRSDSSPPAPPLIVDSDSAARGRFHGDRRRRNAAPSNAAAGAWPGGVLAVVLVSVAPIVVVLRNDGEDVRAFKVCAVSEPRVADDLVLAHA
jgi:hypothetical protein